MRILLTGGAGFIGSNFVHYVLHRYLGASADCCPDQAAYPSKSEALQLLNVDKLTYASDPENLAGVEATRGYEFAKVDICDTKGVEKVFSKFEPDVVVHMAAESHVDRSIEAGDVFVRTNVLGTQVLLDAARRNDVGFFLHVSTDEVYGSIKKGSFRETDPLRPSSPYSASKAGSDLLVEAHRHTYGIKAAITRCTNNYGPRQNPEKLLPKVISLALKDQKLPIYGNGMNVRDWLYVKDHCAAIDLVLRRRPDGEIVNVAAQDERPNLDVVRLVLRSLGKPESLIEFVKDRPGHDWRYSLDDSKLRSWGWKPQVAFPDGLRHSMAWLGAPAGRVKPAK